MTISVHCVKCRQNRDVPVECENGSFYCWQCGSALWMVDPNTGVRWRLAASMPSDTQAADAGTVLADPEPMVPEHNEPAVLQESVPASVVQREAEEAVPTTAHPRTAPASSWPVAPIAIALAALVMGGIFFSARQSEQQDNSPVYEVTTRDDAVLKLSDEASRSGNGPVDEEPPAETFTIPSLILSPQTDTAADAGTSASGHVNNIDGWRSYVTSPAEELTTNHPSSPKTPAPNVGDSRMDFGRGASSSITAPVLPSVDVAGGEDHKSKALHYLSQGIERFSKGDMEAAIAAFGSAIRFNANSATAYYCRGLAYENLGDYAKALADYNTTIDLESDHAMAYLSRGNVFRKARRFDEAIDDYTRCLNLDPQNATAYNNRGNAYCMKADYVKAITDLDRAISLDRECMRAYANRSLAYRQLGAINLAEKDAAEARRLGWKH